MKDKIAKFVKESVEWLQEMQQGCCRYKLDDHLAVFVGWSAGYGEEKRYDVIQAKDYPDYGINVGIKVWTSDDLWTDYDWLNFPYRAEDGEVWDMGMSIAPNDNYEHIADDLLRMYDEAKWFRLADDGKILGVELTTELSNILDENEWGIDYEDDGSIYFSKYSPAGQDFGFSVHSNTIEELAENIFDYYRGYDVSYEASLWLDDDGHGTNGAPYDMKDLYEDMEACEKNILELYELVKEATK
jgi:hypothetical protein